MTSHAKRGMFLLAMKEKIFLFKKKFPYVEYFYLLYLCLTFLALILYLSLSSFAFLISTSNWFIANDHYTDASIVDVHFSDPLIHPILSLLFVMVFPILVFVFLSAMNNRCHLDQIEVTKPHYLLYGAYFYLFYSVVLFFFFLLSNSFIFDYFTASNLPLLFWIFALFAPLVAGVIIYYYWIRKTYPKLNVHANRLSESPIGITDQSVRQLPSPSRINDDSRHYRLIFLSTISLLSIIVGTLLLVISEFQLDIRFPWSGGESFFSFIVFFSPTLFVFFANLAFGVLALLLTIVRFVLKTKVKLHSRKSYALPFLFSLIILFSFLVTPFVVSWRIGELKQSSSQILIVNEVFESDSFSLYNQTSQRLGEFQFDFGVTYMLILCTKGEPLPSRDLELQISFYNSPLEEYIQPLQGDRGREYQLISSRRIKESFEIHLSSNPGSYYYIIPSLRVFIWQYGPIDLSVNCTIRLLSGFPQQNTIPTSIAFVKDPSNIIKKGFIESKNLRISENFYRLILALPAVFIFLNCVLTLFFQYFDQKSKRENSSSIDSKN